MAVADLFAVESLSNAALAADASVPIALMLVVVAGSMYGMRAGIAAAVGVAVLDASITTTVAAEGVRAEPNVPATIALYVAQAVVGGLIGRLRELAIRGERDRTKRKLAETRIEELSAKDVLTGLNNRVSLCTSLEASLEVPAEGGCAVALLSVDVDRFKDVNDALGHRWGDVLLREVAGRLRSLVREGDVVARLGSDEFAVLLPGRDAQRARVVAERIVEELARPFPLAVQTLVISASVGIAFADPESDASSLLRQADIAMYAAKRRRNGIAVYAASADARGAQRLAILGELRNAFARDELLLHYQPQLHVSSGKITGAEALVRWQHPERGLLSPDAFVPLLEEIGMIGQLTDWVLRAAIVQLASWNSIGLRFRMAVNLSAVDLHDGRLSDKIARLIARFEISPKQLCLELTESTVTTDAERVAERLRDLARRGVRISIDDFGTGYSSLALLKHFPVDELKIDRQFVIGMAENSHDAAIVFSTIELAHRLGVDVVVEGVEDALILREIARLRAEYAQGYAISEPLPAKAFETWLRDFGHLSPAGA